MCEAATCPHASAASASHPIRLDHRLAPRYPDAPTSTNGVHASVREWHVRTELADDGLTQRVVHLRVTDKAGRVHELRGDLVRMARGVLREDDRGRTVWLDGLARWTYEGRVGYGIAEYLHQLAPDGRPLVPVT